MARRRRRRRKSAKSSSLVRQRTNRGNKIIRETKDDRFAADEMRQLYKDNDDVLNATDLKLSLDYYKNKHNIE